MKDLGESLALVVMICIPIAFWFVFHGTPSLMDVWHAQLIAGAAK